VGYNISTNKKLREGQKGEREGRMKGREKRGENKKERKNMGEIVGDQTANKAPKPLKKRGKKNHQFWNSRIAGLVVFSCLVSSPVCVCLLGMLGAF
jgi:hypothetical protein